MGKLDLEGEVSPFPGAPKVTRFKLFSESALGGPPPGLYIEDPNIGSVLNYLFEASPELFKRAIRFAWESTRGGGGMGMGPWARAQGPWVLVLSLILRSWRRFQT